MPVKNAESPIGMPVENAESLIEEQSAKLQHEDQELEAPPKKRRSNQVRREPEPAPFWYTRSANELKRIMYSTDATTDDGCRAAAEAELRGRELLCCAILSIMVGGYKEIGNKWRLYCGFVRFSSTANEVREESMLEIARFAFSEEHGDFLCTALAEVLRDLLKVPESFTAKNMKELPLRAVCGLSTRSGPVLIHQEEYYEQIAKNPANVNVIIGSALKERLAALGGLGDDWVRE
jgi:hypothetical protein